MCIRDRWRRAVAENNAGVHQTRTILVSCYRPWTNGFPPTEQEKKWKRIIHIKKIKQAGALAVPVRIVEMTNEITLKHENLFRPVMHMWISRCSQSQRLYPGLEQIGLLRDNYCTACEKDWTSCCVNLHQLDTGSIREVVTHRQCKWYQRKYTLHSRHIQYDNLCLKCSHIKRYRPLPSPPIVSVIFGTEIRPLSVPTSQII